MASFRVSTGSGLSRIKGLAQLEQLMASFRVSTGSGLSRIKGLGWAEG
jgi:hypothetical protein